MLWGSTLRCCEIAYKHRQTTRPVTPIDAANLVVIRKRVGEIDDGLGEGEMRAAAVAGTLAGATAESAI